MTTSMYYEDPDGNFVEMQIDLFDDPDDATAFLVGAEFASDPVGPPFDPEAMVAARRAGASVDELTTQEWASHTVGPDPMTALGGN
ncbi:hypothetical protein [Actinomycetospora termitidis]|uniref:Uncharacterized protein n=1 Tax=Actinomycetospora termitidis TaxID=3053470 RepID=A0ABT7M4P5_9PSEU|nr:hypothetical protein [Actinomycetospora sp. Odt1-22]MDL5155629.1 hypothetical protein [Actinomycetospora sp. Odt1-22]